MMTVVSKERKLKTRRGDVFTSTATLRLNVPFANFRLTVDCSVIMKLEKLPILLSFEYSPSVRVA